MKRSTRMEKLADINLGYENMALAELATARDHYQRHEDQLTQLKIYREDYRNQLADRMSTTTSASAIRDFQYFFSSLDEAIAQQSREVEKAAEALEKVEQNWLSRRQEVKKFNCVADNLRKQEVADSERRSQIESDELANNHFLMNNPGNSILKS